MIRANVESAIMSLLALESHSSVSSCSDVCLTSIAPMTYAVLDQSVCYKESITATYPHRRHAVFVHTLLNLTIHTLKMPPH